MSDPVISVRVSEEQKKAIQEFADSLGMSVSSMALSLLLNAVRHQKLEVGAGVGGGSFKPKQKDTPIKDIYSTDVSQYIKKK